MNGWLNKWMQNPRQWGRPQRQPATLNAAFNQVPAMKAQQQAVMQQQAPMQRPFDPSQFGYQGQNAPGPQFQMPRQQGQPLQPGQNQFQKLLAGLAGF